MKNEIKSILMRLGRVALAGAISGVINALVPVIQEINIVVLGSEMPLSVILPVALISGFGKWLRIQFGLSNVPV